MVAFPAVTAILLSGGCSRNLTQPIDQELITIFNNHRDAFRKLQQMAKEDLQNGWYFHWPIIDGSVPPPDQSRWHHYISIVSGIPQCFSVFTDYDGHMRFLFAEGSYQIWPPYPRWVKGIEFWAACMPMGNVEELRRRQKVTRQCLREGDRTTMVSLLSD
jgi:hypothetical protein